MTAAYYVWSAVAAGLLCFVVGFIGLCRCKHRNRTWPQRGKQRCLDCGAEREYRMGGPVGRWGR